jgi:hypothetical protein
MTITAGGIAGVQTSGSGTPSSNSSSSKSSKGTSSPGQLRSGWRLVVVEAGEKVRDAAIGFEGDRIDTRALRFELVGGLSA